MNRIGIDLGGTKIEGVLLSSDNKMIERKRIHTKQEEGYESIIHRIVKLINNIKSISVKDCNALIELGPWTAKRDILSEEFVNSTSKEVRFVSNQFQFFEIFEAFTTSIYSEELKQ